MAKLRVYQLARELNRDNAEIIRELQHMGVPVTSHSNTVEDRLADRLRRELGVYSPEAEREAADAIVAVETAEAEVQQDPPEPHPPVEAEPPKVEVKAEPKGEPKVEEKLPEPKIAVPPPTPPQPPPAAPKVEQPAAIHATPPPPPPPPAPPQPPQPQFTPQG